MRQKPQRQRWRVLLWLLPCVVFALFVGRLLVIPYLCYLGYEPREGDVLFQSLPRGSLVDAIEGSTQSPWSHCGIVARENGEWVVYEAYGSVQRVSLLAFWRRSRMGQFAVYRLRDEEQKHVARTLECVREYVGLPYDSNYDMDDGKIYCSELIYKAYRSASGQTLGKLVRLGDLLWQDYEQVITRIERGPVPVDRIMITPRDLAAASQLELVRQFGVD